MQYLFSIVNSTRTTGNEGQNYSLLHYMDIDLVMHGKSSSIESDFVLVDLGVFFFHVRRDH